MSVHITQDTEDGTKLYHATVEDSGAIRVRCASEGCGWHREYATVAGVENGTSLHFSQAHKRRIFIPAMTHGPAKAAMVKR